MNIKAKRIIKKINKDPLYFTKEILNQKLWSKQREILTSIWNNPRTTVRGCHGFGKSHTAGNAILSFLYAFKNSIVLSTAPTWRQVEKLIWKEVRSAYNGAKIPLGGKLAEKSPSIQISQDVWYAAGLSTNDPNRFQGFHAENILVIVDEAAGVSEDIYEAIEGVLTSSNAKLLLIGNPTNVSGTFYNSFRDDGWSKIKVSAFDTPNFKYLGITEEDIANGKWEDKFEMKNKKLLCPALITPQWVADKYKRWGPNSIMYIARVKGDFPTSSKDTLIPISWVEAAIERWYDMEEGKEIELGVDVAEYGTDKTVIAEKKGRKIMPLISYSQQGTMETAGCILMKQREANAKYIKIDVCGLGTGVEGRVAEQGLPTMRVNVAESPGGSDKEKEKFLNKRSQLWWSLREQLDPNPLINPNPIALPPDDELMADLCSVKYKINSKGQIQVESKDEIRKRLGRSPDYGDAVVLAVAPINLLLAKTGPVPNIR
jgi:hypothetical protein